MLYTRNKNCFKKTTEKVEHKVAHRQILQLVQQSLQNECVPLSENSPYVAPQCKNSGGSWASNPKHKEEDEQCEWVSDRVQSPSRKYLQIDRSVCRVEIAPTANVSKSKK